MSDYSQELVSIIIPTYNRSWGLELAVQSVLAQSHQNYELFIVDDCSEDDTSNVAQSFKDERISYCRQPVNVGMVKNWGQILRFAHGEFIIFLSDDDQLRPGFITNRLKHIANDSDVIVVFSKYEVRDRYENTLKIQNEKLDTEIVHDSLGLLRAALSRQWFVGTSIYRKSVLQKVWPQVAKDDLVLDLALNIRLALSEMGRGVYINECDFIMTSHPGQNSEKWRARVYEQVSDSLARVLKEETRSSYAPLIRRELASWNLVWGRYLAANGLIGDARAKFFAAARICPQLLPAWKQLGASLLFPRRIIASARKQYSQYIPAA